ncbi:MAG: hypothetical protein IJC43_06965, partial [Clostridia bacterium]|nr:hypothetical protein [Clostridia bacterium]
RQRSGVFAVQRIRGGADEGHGDTSCQKIIRVEGLFLFMSASFGKSSLFSPLPACSARGHILGFSRIFLILPKIELPLPPST